MARTIKDVLIANYYVDSRRRARNAYELTWLVTQDLSLINMSRYAEYRSLSINGLYKKVMEFDFDGESYFVCGCTEGTKNFNDLIGMGWEAIPEEKLDMLSKEVRRVV